MTVNLLKKIHEKIDDRLVGQIGTVLGENEDRTRAGVNAAVPTLLRGVMGVATTEQGTQMVERELDPFDDGIIHDYGKQLEFEKSRKLIDDGSDLVQAFFGNATVRTMGVVSRESGLGASKCRSLTGLLMPLVLGVVGERRKEKNLDTAGFQHLLAGQNDHIARKVPDGVCAALNLPKLEKKPFYPPQNAKPTLSPYLPSATAGAGLVAANLADSGDETSPTPNGSASTTSSSVATHEASDSSVSNSNAQFTGAKNSKSPKAVLSQEGYYEGGAGWIWGAVLPLILLLGLLGWIFSRSTSSEPSTDDKTSQVTNGEHIDELPSWDAQPPEFDTDAMLNEDIPTIAPSISDLDEDEDNEESRHDGNVETKANESTKQSNSSDTRTSQNTLSKNGIPPKENAERRAAAPAALNAVSSTTSPATSAKVPDTSALEAIEPSATASPNPKFTNALVAEATVATAFTRPSQSNRASQPNHAGQSHRTGQPHRIVPIAASTATIATDSTIPDSVDLPSSDSTNLLADRFSRITQGVTDALQQIESVEDAELASKTVSRLSNDLYDLAPHFRGIDKDLRQELNKQTNTFASDIEGLYDGQIDEVDEKAVLLPTLIVLMQRIEATLNS